jgi:cytochrome c oxidase assembly protein subunit 15
MIDSQTTARFRRLGILTIIAIYCVILAGGIVRASGAGMGCPDWPKCFGQWIPPTDEAQLPANYHEIYAARGYENTTFNPVKTWTEYSNRLIGATSGLLVLLLAWSSRNYRNSDKGVFQLSLAILLVIGFQGWLGSAVVASNLKPLMITLHMLLAWFLVILLIYTVTRSQKDLLAKMSWTGPSPRFALVLKVAMGLTLLQVAMGTQVREAVDFVSHGETGLNREYWRESFPIIFYVHRSFSSLILFTNLWLSWNLYRQAGTPALLRRCGYAISGLVITAILAGVSLDRLGFPAIAQPLHLLMANLIFGAQFFLFICLNYSRPKAIG